MGINPDDPNINRALLTPQSVRAVENQLKAEREKDQEMIEMQEEQPKTETQKVSNAIDALNAAAVATFKPPTDSLAAIGGSTRGTADTARQLGKQQVAELESINQKLARGIRVEGDL